jgi:hypothetical protein
MSTHSPPVNVDESYIFFVKSAASIAMGISKI